MNPKGEAIEELRKNGYKKMTGRKNARHDLYYNEELKSRIPVSRGTHFDNTDRDRIIQEIRQAKRRTEQ
ncbi:MAG: hypothetical protein IK127_04740 [Clostridia bacterium]|nr:hypothetical protein [Clostridia bacterium]